MEGMKSQGSQHVSSLMTGLLVCLTLLLRTSTSILTPIWLDAKNNDTSSTDTCNARMSDHQVDAFCIMFITSIILTIISGVTLLVIKIFYPAYITEEDQKHDKKQFAVIGLSDVLSAVCILYASSGCRTAPYLQSLAANFSVPVTFIVRYFVLQKRPTRRKLVCAGLVLIAEFIALLPNIFPSLESRAAKTNQGGASGVAGVLWPMCFAFGFIPMALLSVYMEKAIKPSQDANTCTCKTNEKSFQRKTELNMAYFMFWTYFFTLLPLVMLFWVDIIPGFGMSDSITEFANGFWFNLKCFFGYEGCTGLINVVSFACIACLYTNRLVCSYFLRYLEGANYLVIVYALQTPLVFLFFTLFNENPVKWHPHAYLSTWLSVAALCIMVPAIYFYNTGAQEVVSSRPEVFTVQGDGQTDQCGNGDSHFDNACKHSVEPSETSPLLST